MHEDNWLVTEIDIPGLSGKKADAGKSETLFSLANGNVGMRGDFEESQPAWQRGTYINGFFETEPIVYGELAYGFAKNHQTMLNVPDGRLITICVDGETFDMTKGTALSYRRTLDMRSGIVERNLAWRLPNGREIELRSRRLVSFARPEVAAISWSVRLRGEKARVRITSSLDLGSRNIRSGDDPRVGSKLAEDPVSVENVSFSADPHRRSGIVGAEVRTKKSGLGIACAALSILVEGSLKAEGRACSACRRDDLLEVVFEGIAEAGQEIGLVKYLAYSRPERNGGMALMDEANAAVAEAARLGFEALAGEQRVFLDKFWESADITVEGDDSIQQALRFNLFHLLQSAGRGGRANLAAKGLSGEGYEGHYFWDTEIYALPIFTFTKPEVARDLLMYRHSILDKARARAGELDYPGALYPWRTIDGTEASAYFEAGTAQYHINADIILAARRYALVSGDREFMYGPLAEMAVETARFWLSLGDFIDRRGVTVGDLIRRQAAAQNHPEEADLPAPSGVSAEPVFCINCVTGPDEYSAMVNNNVYTNAMAWMNLDFAAQLIGSMQSESPVKYRELSDRLCLGENEAAEWARAADRMFIPYDRERGLYPQDDSFFNKAVWDVNEEPAANRPLLLHYHPLNIYRYQVLKQPDLVLAQFLQGDLFSPDEKKRNFSYYEKITTGDSSLSHCIQSVMAAEIGETDKAWKYFCKTVRMDIDDLHNNVIDGIHAAAMAGSWLSMIYGFAGFRDHVRSMRMSYSFAPTLPAALSRLRFRLFLGTGTVELDCHRLPDGGRITGYRLIAGESAEFTHRGKDVFLDDARRECSIREADDE